MVQEAGPNLGLDNFDKFEIFMTGVEDILNPLGYIPIVSSIFTAEVRGMLASVQIIGSLVSLPFMFIADLFGNARGAFYGSSKCLTHLFHGTGNFIRSVFEAIPVFGNICTIVYDNVLGLRMRYPIEYTRPQIFERVQYLNPQIQGV